MRFGPEFVSVEEVLLRLGIAGGRPVSLEISRLLRQPESTTLYFAGRDFLVTSMDGLPQVTLANGRPMSVLVVPENKTLWFGPGGMLTLGPDILLVIRGRIRAEAATIFSLPEVRLRTHFEGTSIVRLENPWLEDVFVEWFGAESRFSEARERYAEDTSWRNQRAIQACLHAACRDRSQSNLSSLPGDPWAVPEIGPRLPPLTVVLRGIYDVIGTLYAVALPGERPSLVQLRQRDPDGAFARSRQSREGHGRSEVLDEVAVFQPTGFFGEDAKEVARKQSESARWHTVNSFDRLTVSDSWFEYGTDNRSLPSMIRLEGVARSVRLSVDRCAFRGRARAMIAAPAGVLIITSCSFAVESAADGSTGTDLLLGSLARGHPGAGAAAPIHLVETHVRASSVSLLQCERLSGGPDSMVSITGLRHDPVVTAMNGSASFIRWEGPIGSGLLLQGCTIAGRVELLSPMDRIILLATERRGEITRAEPPVWTRMVP